MNSNKINSKRSILKYIIVKMLKPKTQQQEKNTHHIQKIFNKINS